MAFFRSARIISNYLVQAKLYPLEKCVASLNVEVGVVRFLQK